MNNSIMDGIAYLTLAVALTAVITFLILAARRRDHRGINRDLVVGSTSSIIAAMIIWLAVNTFSGLILPWYNKFFYAGLDLSGKWAIKVGPHGDFSKHLNMTANLRQFNDKVSGTLTVLFKNRPDQGPLHYTLSGFRREQFLSIAAGNISSRQVGAGTSLVQMVNAGNTLKGYLCAYDTSRETLRCDDCEWTRISDED